MSEDQNKLSVLEQKLLERERDRVIVQLGQALATIREALSPYLEKNIGRSEGFRDAGRDGGRLMAEWLCELFPTWYYAGDHMSVAHMVKPPEFLRAAMLEKAVADHLADVDRLREVSSTGESE